MIETADLLALAPHADRSLLSGLVPALNVVLPVWRLAAAPRLPHFLAQAAHETDAFRTLEEYASGADYEGRADLGNVLAGDGRRFKGRGIFQTTGRRNYAGEADRLLYLAMAEVIWPAPAAPSIAVPSARQIQQSLNALGAVPPLAVDGSIGPLTAEAIRKFQAAHGLVPDGHCGEVTWAAVMSALADLP